MSSVQVAVRVRPFNEREKSMAATVCIEMNSKATTIINPEDPRTSRRNFAFDYSYWSHDEFETDESGYSYPLSSRYADQQKVYDDVGKNVLDNAFDGYNACLFAYGQTGSGKSYSMVGYGANKGIVVRACEEIFERISQNKDPDYRAEVTVSMLEIYNEQVQDLLVKTANREKGGLKIRHTPQLGTFVENLTEHPVDSYTAISRKLDEGTANRTVGATLMNATSSRAHTVLTIKFKQVALHPSTKEALSQKSSDINLVDLAGSERAGSTGAGGDRLKEGAAINKSLSALGNVISALADKASGKLKAGQVVPYRDSALTRILQTALGGNSKTAMIAALSPASVNFDETLSTLRYADRVKQIKNEAQVNENPMEKLIRELKEENERLKKSIGTGGAIDGGPQGIDPDQVEAIKRQYEEELSANKKALEEISKSWDTKISEAKARDLMAQQEEAETTCPHLKNLNEDPLLSGVITSRLKVGENVLGKKDSDSPPDVLLGGLGILRNHSTIVIKEVKEEDDDVEYQCSIVPNAKTHINGKLLQSGQSYELNHKDRILFGNHNLFVYIDPNNMDKTLPEWDEAMKEVNKDVLDTMTGEESASVRELQARLDIERITAEKKVQGEKKAAEKTYKEFLKQAKARQEAISNEENSETVKQMKEDIEKERQRKQMEMEKMKEKLEKKLLDLSKEHEEERKNAAAELRAKMVLEEIVSRTIMLLEEANCIADEMGKGVFFSIKLVTRADATDIAKKKIQRVAMQNTEIQIRVERVEEDTVQFWSLEVFEEKMFEIRELYSQWSSSDEELAHLEGGQDPFASDPDTLHVLGQAYLYLDPIRNLVDVEKETTPIFDYKGGKVGELTVILKMELLGEDWTPSDLSKTLDEKKHPHFFGNVKTAALTDFADNPLTDYDTIEELQGRTIKLTIGIDSARNLNGKYCRNPEVVYRWIDGATEYKVLSAKKERTTGLKYEDDVTPRPSSEHHEVITSNPKFHYAKEFCIPINEETLQWFDGALVFEVYAMISTEEARHPAAAVSGLEAQKSDGSLQQKRRTTLRSDGVSAEKFQEKEEELAKKSALVEELGSKLSEKELMLQKVEEELLKNGQSLYNEDGSPACPIQ